MISYFCEACQIKIINQTYLKKHLKTKKHIKQADTNALIKCDLCNYKGYNAFLLYQHKRNTHKLKNDVLLDKKKCKEKINNLLIDFKIKNIDLNKYFNYNYYGLNISKLNKIELNDFLKELQTINL